MGIFKTAQAVQTHDITGIESYVAEYSKQQSENIPQGKTLLAHGFNNNNSDMISGFIQFLAQQGATVAPSLFLEFFVFLIRDKKRNDLTSLMKLMRKDNNVPRDFGTRLLLLALLHNDENAVSTVLAQDLVIFWNRFYADEKSSKIRDRITYKQEKGKDYIINISPDMQQIISTNMQLSRRQYERYLELFKQMFDTYREDFRENLKFLLTAGFNIDTPLLNGKNALHLACERGYLKYVEILAEHAANLNALTDDGATPLQLALDNSKMDIAPKLLEEKADINARDLEGNTCLHKACKAGDVTAVAFLLRNKADTKLTSHNGDTALHIATQKNHPIIVDKLLSEKSSINISNTKNRSTALLIAAKLRNVKVYQKLVKAGADSNARDAAGKTVNDLLPPQELAVRAAREEAFSKALDASGSDEKIAVSQMLSAQGTAMDGFSDAVTAKQFANTFVNELIKNAPGLKVEDYVHIFLLLQYSPQFKALRVKQTEGTEKVNSIHFFSAHAASWRKVVYALKCFAVDAATKIVDPAEKEQAFLLLAKSELIAARTRLQFVQSTFQKYVNSYVAASAQPKKDKAHNKLVSYNESMMFSYKLKTSYKSANEQDDDDNSRVLLTAPSFGR